MYKAIVRSMIRKTVDVLNAGDYRPTLAMFAGDATLTFPGDNSWSRQFTEPGTGRESFPTHRGRAEIEAFLRPYVDAGVGQGPHPGGLRRHPTFRRPRRGAHGRARAVVTR